MLDVDEQKTSYVDFREQEKLIPLIDIIIQR